MSKLKLHLDADAASRSLHTALVGRGHDVTRSPCEWMPADATDEEQLLGATAHGRCIFTFNARDFAVLADLHPNHAGIIMAAQRSWSLAELIEALDRALMERQAEEMAGRVRWLNDWRARP